MPNESPDHSGSAPAPAPLLPMVGRERELALAASLLRRDDVRLLTLTGPGGIGKTRLALTLIDMLGGDYANGVYFAPLAAVTDPNLVASAIARAAGLVERGDLPVRDSLPDALRQTEALLVLDNFEHVLTAAPLLSDLLSACPRLKMLVTSRTLLRVTGEYALPVPPLSVVDLNTPDQLDSVPGSPAVELFVQRGQAVNPSFTLTAANAPIVADICQRLDGVPLAIELAAARVTHLSLPALRERLERRLPLLTGGGRDRPLRLQTMRNAITWSHDLLPPEECILFRRLAVFVDGCNLDAVEAIAGDTEHAPQPHANVVDAIAALVEASLLRSEIGPDGSLRYRMLETIREFAEERLAESGEADTMRSQHASYYLALAERNTLAQLRPDADQIVRLLEAEHANLRAALTWFSQTGDHENLLKLAAALGRFWTGQGYYQEARTWLEHALANQDGADGDRAKALVALGMVQLYQGANLEAEQSLIKGQAGCRASGDVLQATVALIGLGGLAIMRDDLDRGTSLLEDALATAHGVDDSRLAGIVSGWVLINLAVTPRIRGEYALATAHLEEALRLHRDAGYTDGVILALGDLGNLARDQGDAESAMARYQEALAAGSGQPGTRVVIEVIEAIGIMAAAAGRAERAARLLGSARAQRDRIGLRYGVRQDQTALEHAVATSQDTLGDQAFAAAWAAGSALNPGEAIAEARKTSDPNRDLPRGLLTPREDEILHLLVAGMTNPAIAATLSLSVRTVENHVAHILTKLGVRTRAAAAAAAAVAHGAPVTPQPDRSPSRQ